MAACPPHRLGWRRSLVWLGAKMLLAPLAYGAAGAYDVTFSTYFGGATGGDVPRAITTDSRAR